MGNLAISELAYAHPGGELLFSDVSFRVVRGRHAALVGVNGIGKSTLLRIVAGELDPLEGTVARGGRLFFLGVGGSAANCSHAVNDFRKIAGIECYAPTDNVAELTARTNDEGWQSVFAEWLKVSRLAARDGVFIMSVGGGSLEKNISANIVLAIQHARNVGARVTGIVD